MRKDGTRVHISLTMSPNRDETGRIVGASGTGRDIPARERAEAAQRFLVEASTMLAASLDPEATLESVTRLAVPALADYCVIDLLTPDLSREAVTSAHVDPARAELVREMVHRFPPDPTTWHPLAKMMRTGQPELVPEADAVLPGVVNHPEHREILRQLNPRSCMLVPLVARGQTLGVISLVSADSGRRYGPDDLALAEELAHRAALAIDNARLYHEAQAAIRVRDEFLARASHELRTPLTSAFGTIRLLKQAAAGRVKESPEALIDIASRNLSAMVLLIDQLLDASKLQVGQETLVREAVEVGMLVSDSLQVVAAHAREKGVALKLEVPAGLTLLADRLKLEQVLINLLANAVKFTPSGGEVAAEAEAKRGGVIVRVRDTGEGIAREHLERIFEPFFQAGEAAPRPPGDRRARRVRGMGLGLAICRQIVVLHGGRIWAESEGRGQGSTFTIQLPAESAAGGQAA